MLNYYSKFENRLLTLFVAVLIALAFAISSAKAAELTMVNSATNIWRTRSADSEGSFSAFQWGIKGDVQVPADYDGDGSQDLAVWRPSSGTWYILGSQNGKFSQVTWDVTRISKLNNFKDVAVPADYDGDGMSDIAIWNPANGKWFVLTSKSNFTASTTVEWGASGDVPVPADYDGDGRTDAAVFRPRQNRWLIAQSRTGDLVSHEFGVAGKDILVPADYTGDGRADIAVYRAGTWHVFDLATKEIEIFSFGYADAQPVPADYNGDGTTDFAFYRDGSWHIYESGEPLLRVIRFGAAGEVPLNSLCAKASLVTVR